MLIISRKWILGNLPLAYPLQKPQRLGLLHLIAIAVAVVISEIWCGVKTVRLQSDLFAL
jgi:hypothetical protein